MPALLDLVDIKGVLFVVHGQKPDVLHAVFPIAFGAAALFSLPGNPVLDREVSREDRRQCNTGLPIGKNVETGVGLQLRFNQVNPTLGVLLVFVGRLMLKIQPVVVFIQVIGRVNQG